ncbi:retrovirus-related Pol polyprotein LINE-1 [Elysia marginata]|uniref:Retrovirus-related Pol polyprotein LINE-1 n=1 Tax=Elysia marginata TaxID=1093978 RepID=A0AAV4FT02_9GAST|nr:retrovirus-related Pol polyprotein LINE-1 [Elysia marginata]
MTSVHLELTTFVTRKGATGILLQGFKFRKDHQTSVSINWRCCNPKCKARCKTDIEMKQITSQPSEHNHPKCDSRELDLNDVRSACKRKAVDQSTARASKIILEDNSGKLVINPNDVLTIVAEYFKSKFQDVSIENIDAFQGPPKALDKPITAGEVRKSLDRLKNNTASGQDGISAELLKYGTKALDEQLAVTFNDTFEKHQDPNIYVGELIAIPKPGKPKGPPKNLRPITLLNTIQKALSIITLNRIRPQVEKYLSPSQSGFRPDRSTADVVWTHKWLAAKTNAENVEIKITGIDMSAAFDTIDRKALLDILKTIVDEDEVRIIRFLLSNTVVNTKVNKATEEKPFISNVGTPQGDSLSPVLFIIYLEHALRDIRTNISPPTDIERLLPREVAYADDVDFVSLEFVKVEELQKALERHRLCQCGQNRFHDAFKEC